MSDSATLVHITPADLVLGTRGDPIALAIAACLDSTQGRSGSPPTSDAYAATLPSTDSIVAAVLSLVDKK